MQHLGHIYTFKNIIFGAQTENSLYCLYEIQISLVSHILSDNPHCYAICVLSCISDQIILLIERHIQSYLDIKYGFLHLP